MLQLYLNKNFLLTCLRFKLLSPDHVTSDDPIDRADVDMIVISITLYMYILLLMEVGFMVFHMEDSMHVVKGFNKPSPLGCIQLFQKPIFKPKSSKHFASFLYQSCENESKGNKPIPS